MSVIVSGKTGDSEFRPLADAGLIGVDWLPRRRA